MPEKLTINVRCVRTWPLRDAIQRLEPPPHRTIRMNPDYYRRLVSSPEVEVRKPEMGPVPAFRGIVIVEDPNIETFEFDE